MTRPRPPGGDPPPQSAHLPGGGVVELAPLAARIAEHYYAEYPDEDERYGEAGRAWCIHDNLYLLAWAFGAQRGELVFEGQVIWLARVLHGRAFPLDRLARDLQIAASVVAEQQIEDAANVAAILRDGAIVVERQELDARSGN